jgi:hypothetical protein
MVELSSPSGREAIVAAQTWGSEVLGGKYGRSSKYDVSGASCTGIGMQNAVLWVKVWAWKEERGEKIGGGRSCSFILDFHWGRSWED